MKSPLPMIIRQLGQQPFIPVWQAMQTFTLQRSADTPDEIWLLQHPSVYTLGRNGKAEHILNPGDIPILHTDRGGQVTYHAPGQLIAYLMLDLNRRDMGVRQLVSGIEHCLIQVLKHYHIDAYADKKAPGVYIDGAKIAALGLRIKKGCSFHGLSLNIDMDLTPFKHINPCGYPGLEVIQLTDFTDQVSINEVGNILVQQFSQLLDIKQIISINALPDPL